MHNPNTPHKTAITIIAIIIALTPLIVAQTQAIQITNSQEYLQFVHTAINSSKGNITALDKPIFPIMINSGQIQIGQNWTITCPLQADHNYHIYCYGTWTNTQTEAKTDYDIYVYDPSSQLVSTHTQAAGIIENINSQNDPNFFIPAQTGNYTFIIINDPRESLGAQQATFTIVENIDCNKWYSVPIQGKNNDGTSNPQTTWTYEFVTDAPLINVYLTVPSVLDMYEARLFLMNDGSGPTENNYPLAVELNLYGNTTGGYNFETNGSRGVVYASCPHLGDDMLLSYTATSDGTKLYYLTLIGEVGQGDVECMVKTNFDQIALEAAQPVSRVYPGRATNISYKTSGFSLQQANLSYSIDDWTTTEWIPMDISNQTCTATVPGQSAGLTVQYKIDATDILKNSLFANGSYTVKTQPKLNITIAKDTLHVGQNITITGTLTPSDADSAVDLQFMSSTETQTLTCEVSANGTFTCSFGPQTAGDWSVLAKSHETDSAWSANSSQYIVTVTEPPIYVKYSLYIVIGLVAACAAGGAVYYLKFRGR
jgi:hypothetical protein